MPAPLSNSIERFVFDWRESAWPVAWNELFLRDAPLVLEIGFGNGQFLVDQALEHPDKNHVGIELSWSGATRLFKRVHSAGIENVRALLIDAEVALRELFTTEALDAVFVNHPCPWPKARHIGRRLLHPDCLALLADRLRADAPITIVTDHAEYATWLTDVLLSQSALVSRHPTVEVDAIEGRRPTKYEAKARAQGIPIHFFEWKKAAAPLGSFDGRFASLPATPDMTSILLRGPIDPSTLFADFVPHALRETHDGIEVSVRLVAVYKRENPKYSGSWMVEVLVQEDGLRQEFAVIATLKRDGGLLVKLSGLGRPHPTHGVRRALFGISEWLRARHPELTVAHENLGETAMTPLPLSEAADDDERG